MLPIALRVAEMTRQGQIDAALQPHAPLQPHSAPSRRTEVPAVFWMSVGGLASI